jgi:hypothetical protein
LATILTLSIAYYFALALPAHNKALLDFEKEKYRNDQAAMNAKEQKELEETAMRKLRLSTCLAKADQQYQIDVESNGTRNGKGGFSVPTDTVAVLDRRHAAAVSECHRSYDQ